MKYIIILLLLVLAIHPLSYAKYCWSKKNKLGALGVILIALLAIAAPSVLLIMQ